MPEIVDPSVVPSRSADTTLDKSGPTTTIVGSSEQSKSSACAEFTAHPIDWTWCKLEGLSSGLQSVQILLLAVVALVGFWQARPKRLSFSKPKNISKSVIQIDKSRLTAVTQCHDGSFYVSGFSGLVYHINSKHKKRSLFRTSIGLVRSLFYMSSSKLLIIGCDDGTLYAADNTLSSPIKLLGVASPIYRISLVSGQEIALSMGNGGLVVCSIFRSPGQTTEVIGRIVYQTQIHNGSAFDLSVDRNICTSVGADGFLVSTDLKTRSERYRVAVSSETVWAVEWIEGKRFITADNAGNIKIYDGSRHITSRNVHKSSSRQLFLSPAKRWVISAGKDRCIYALPADLSASYLLHRADDYVYDGFVSANGTEIIVCDGAGNVSTIKLQASIDSLDANQLQGILG